MADSLTTRDAVEAAGWRVVHEGTDPSDENSTGNSELWRAEKYVNQPGRAGVTVEAQALTEQKLYDAIAWREQNFGTPFEFVTTNPAQNDTLTVREDDGSIRQKVIRSGVELAPEDAEVTHEQLSEEVTPGSTQAETDARVADAAAIAKAKELRDEAGAANIEEADDVGAQAEVAAARHEAWPSPDVPEEDASPGEPEVASDVPVDVAPSEVPESQSTPSAEPPAQ